MYALSGEDSTRPETRPLTVALGVVAQRYRAVLVLAPIAHASWRRLWISLIQLIFLFARRCPVTLLLVAMRSLSSGTLKAPMSED